MITSLLSSSSYVIPSVASTKNNHYNNHHNWSAIISKDRCFLDFIIFNLSDNVMYKDNVNLWIVSNNKFQKLQKLNPILYNR